MADRVEPADPARPDGSGDDLRPLLWERPAVHPLDVVPIGPNVLATLAGFVALMVAPWLSLYGLNALWEDAIGEDRVAFFFLLTSLPETALNALAGALLFLVIGAILQVWRHHRPFPARWPLILAMPVAWGLILPESLVQGGTLVSGAVIGAVLGLAFGVHWTMVVVLTDAID